MHHLNNYNTNTNAVEQLSNAMQQMQIFPPASYAQKKLRLVIDLDNTLVHVTRTLMSTDVKLFWADLRDVLHTKEPFFTDNNNEVFYFKTKKNVRYVKFRPGCFEFLIEASKHFELWIDTLAKRTYAQGVIDMIEHRCGPIFGKRVITRHDHMVASTKNLDYHHCHNTLIIDDNIASVWRNTANLITISPFYFFSAAPATLASAPRCPSSSPSSLPPTTTFLCFDSILQIVKRIHRDYMSSQDNVSVQQLLSLELSCGALEISGQGAQDNGAAGTSTSFTTTTTTIINNNDIFNNDSADNNEDSNNDDNDNDYCNFNDYIGYRRSCGNDACFAQGCYAGAYANVEYEDDECVQV